MRRALSACVLAAALLAAPGAARAADETLAELPREARVSGFGEHLAWSAFDPASGTYRLLVRTGEVTRPLPVRPSRRPFDVDLGPGPDGSVVAAFTRCGRRCDTYMYDLRSGVERRLPGTTSASDESLPSVWRDRVAFVRETRGRHVLYVRDFDEARSRRVTAGEASEPAALELYGRRVASTWTAPAGDGREWELRLHTLGGGGVSVRRTVSGALSSVRMLEPAFEGGALYFGIGRRGSAGNRFGRHRLRDGVLDEALSRPGLVHLTFAGGRFVYVQGPLSDLDEPCDPAAPCLLRRADPVAFGPR